MSRPIFDLDAWSAVGQNPDRIAAAIAPPWTEDEVGRVWCVDCARSAGRIMPAGEHVDMRPFDTRSITGDWGCAGCGCVFVYERRDRDGGDAEERLNAELRRAWAGGWRGGTATADP